MLPDRFPPDDPREWLNRARSSLTRAQTETPGTYYEDPCFDAQQAAEKAIKAVLMARRIRFPYVHDLGKLLVLVQDIGEEIPATVAEAPRLTRYAFTTRYPNLVEPATATDYAMAVALAEAVVVWAEGLVGYRASNGGSA